MLKYLHVNNLIQALGDDPDLATLTRDSLPSIIQTLYFKKHLSSFVSLHGVETVNQLHHTTDMAKSVEERHKDCIQKSEVLLVIGYQMRRNECPHTH